METPVDQFVSFFIPHTPQHSDRIGALDSKLFMLRMVLSQLAEWVEYLEENLDIAKIRIILVQGQLQEARDELQLYL